LWYTRVRACRVQWCFESLPLILFQNRSSYSSWSQILNSANHSVSRTGTFINQSTSKANCFDYIFKSLIEFSDIYNSIREHSNFVKLESYVYIWEERNFLCIATNEQSPRAKSSFESWHSLILSRISPHFMETEFHYRIHKVPPLQYTLR